MQAAAVAARTSAADRRTAVEDILAVGGTLAEEGTLAEGSPAAAADQDSLAEDTLVACCHIVPCFRCLEGAFVDVRGSDWGSGKVHSSSEEFAKGFTRKQSFPSCVVNEHDKSEGVTSMRIFVAFAYMLLVIKL